MEARALLAAGDLDLSFGAGGKVWTNIVNESFDGAADVALQGDGRIIVVGTTWGGYLPLGDVAVVRYQPDGSLDPSFGAGGKVVTDFGGPGPSETGHAVAVQADGKIVVVGTSGFDFVLARYDSSGNLDPTFGTGGLVTTDVGSFYNEAWDVVIQPDGKLIVAGGWGGFILLRYDTSGNLDPSFGVGGKVEVTTGVFGSGCAYNLALQSDGMIVAAGTLAGRLTLARFDTSGNPDASFGNDGLVIDDSLTRTDGALVQPDGRIIVVAPSSDGFVLARYDRSGSLDPSFGSGGKATADFGPGVDGAFAVAMQSDGKLVVAGVAGGSGVDDNDFGLARFDTSGNLDVGFGAGGKVTTDFGSESDRAWAVVIQPDGKIIAAGSAVQGTPVRHANFALARYESNTAPVADAGGPYTPREGSLITFDASHSTDPDSDPLQYRWDFESDGTWDTDWSASPTASYAWLDAPAGAVTVEVSDGRLSSTAHADIRLKIPVQIDVNPDHGRRPVWLRSGRRIAVALSTTPQFDADQIDISTVQFAGATLAKSSYRDLDRDGDLDLLMHFRMRHSKFQATYTDRIMENDLHGIFDCFKWEITVTLTGQTKHGAIVEGSDTVFYPEAGHGWWRQALRFRTEKGWRTST